MSSIENRDVKSLSEIQSAGGQKSDLTHDSKIYVTAKGLNKTLSEIIESGEIADGNRFGADVKNFAVAVADGSGEEYNTDVPYVNGDGHTQLDLHFEVKDLEVAQLYVGGEYYTKYINDDITKNNWWRIVNDTSIEIKGDLTSETVDLNFIVFRGSEIPVVPSVFAGLKIENEAFGFTDSPNGDGVANVTVASSKTVIEFDFDIKPSSVIFVYVDGEIWPLQSPSNNTGKWFNKLSDNVIELGQDLSGSTIPFYVAVFQGKSQVDSFGNMIVTLKPKIATFLIESPNGNKWQVGVQADGEFDIDSVVTSDAPSRILFRRDDNTIVELFIEDSGALAVDLPVNAGILFETIFLSTVDGMVRTLGALNDNTPYTSPHGQNYFDLIRPNGNVIKRIQAQENNAVYEFTGYTEEVPPAPVDVPPNTVLTTLVRSFGGGFNILSWDTIRQKWGDTILSFSTPFGVAVDFYGKKEKIPSNFRVADGSYLEKNKYPVLFETIGTRYGESEDKEKFKLPDLRGVVSRGVDDGRGIDQNTRVNPEGLGERDEDVGTYQKSHVGAHFHYIGNGDVKSVNGGRGLVNASVTAGGNNGMVSFYRYGGNSTYASPMDGDTYKAKWMEEEHGRDTTMHNVACYKIMKVN